MKINLGKLAAIAAQLIVAVPAVIAAVRPVIAAGKPSKTAATSNDAR